MYQSWKVRLISRITSNWLIRRLLLRYMSIIFENKLVWIEIKIWSMELNTKELNETRISYNWIIIQIQIIYMVCACVCKCNVCTRRVCKCVCAQGNVFTLRVQVCVLCVQVCVCVQGNVVTVCVQVWVLCMQVRVCVWVCVVCQLCMCSVFVQVYAKLLNLFYLFGISFIHFWYGIQIVI